MSPFERSIQPTASVPVYRPLIKQNCGSLHPTCPPCSARLSHKLSTTFQFDDNNNFCVHLQVCIVVIPRMPKDVETATTDA